MYVKGDSTPKIDGHYLLYIIIIIIVIIIIYNT